MKRLWELYGLLGVLVLVQGILLLQLPGCKWVTPPVGANENKPSPAAPSSTAPSVDKALVEKGQNLLNTKGCVACHSTDGSKRIGPTFLGMYGSQRYVITAGKERVVLADVAFIKKSILDPKADLAKGFEQIPMVVPPTTDDEITAMTAYLATLGKATIQPPTPSKLADHGKKLVQEKACLTCHSLDGSRLVAPTFLNIFGRDTEVYTNNIKRKIKVDEEYLKRSILEPDKDLVAGYHFKTMPRILLTQDELASIITFLKIHKGTPAATGKTDLPDLSVAEKKKASEIYFNRCAGCHGMLRKGATGPALLPERLRSRNLTTASLETFVTYGLPGGMPPLGQSGILSPDEVNLIARFLQHEPPAPPELSLQEMKNFWKLHIPVDKRPTKPEHTRNWQNFFGVVLRDAGKVVIFDGDTKEQLGTLTTGFAVHILRSSGSGRYFYSIGRDGRVTMIDLWSKSPTLVAEGKVCYDARSVDSSKYSGPKGDFMDKFLIVGCYWPPSFVVMDGQTLEPKRAVSTSSYTYDTNEFLREARVAAIMASHYDTQWVLNIKETGFIWLVDYSNIDNLKIIQIAAERFLHDGGFDSTHRYVLMAANARNSIAVVDMKDQKLVSLVKVGAIPHPGRGANFKHPEFGPVWCTGHLGDNTIQCIGTDPVNYPKNAWKVVLTMTMTGEGGGNLFIKTHPNSRWLWADRTLHPKSELYRSIFVFDRVSGKLVKTFTVPEEFPGRAVHIEYNKDGTEAIVSAWSPQNKPSALLIYDDKTLTLKTVIKGSWLITPTGKWNVYNTMKDLY